MSAGGGCIGGGGDASSSGQAILSRLFSACAPVSEEDGGPLAMVPDVLNGFLVLSGARHGCIHDFFLRSEPALEEAVSAASAGRVLPLPAVAANKSPPGGPAGLYDSRRVAAADIASWTQFNRADGMFPPFIGRILGYPAHRASADAVSVRIYVDCASTRTGRTEQLNIMGAVVAAADAAAGLADFQAQAEAFRGLLVGLECGPFRMTGVRAVVEPC